MEMMESLLRLTGSAPDLQALLPAVRAGDVDVLEKVLGPRNAQRLGRVAESRSRNLTLPAVLHGTSLARSIHDVEKMMSGTSTTWSMSWTTGNHFSMLEPSNCSRRRGSQLNRRPMDQSLPVVPEASSGFAFVRETLHEITGLQSCLNGFKDELSQLRGDLEREQNSRKEDNESLRRHVNRSLADESQMRVSLESKLEAFQNLSKTWIASLGKDVMASKERLNALDGTTEQHGSALLAHEERRKPKLAVFPYVF
eukprot:g27052.t1